MDEFGAYDIQDAHHMFSLFDFPLVIVFVLTLFHSCGDVDRAEVQQCFHGLIGPFGYLGFRPDGRARFVFVWCKTGEAAEVTGILEAGEPGGNGNHIDGDSVTDAVNAHKELLLACQYRVCANKRFYLGVNVLYLLVYGLDDFLPARTLMLEVVRGHILLLVSQLGLIPFPVNEQELPVREKVLHGDYGILSYHIADSFVVVAIGVFGDSGCVDGIVLPTDEAERVLDAGGVVQPEEQVQLLASHRQRVDVSARVFGAHERLVKRYTKCPE